MDAHYHISARLLGAVEKLFWLLDQNRLTHLAAVGVIEGRIPIDTWQYCLDELGWATPHRRVQIACVVRARMAPPFTALYLLHCRAC